MEVTDGLYRHVEWKKPALQESYDRAWRAFLAGDAGRAVPAFGRLVGKTRGLPASDESLVRSQAAVAQLQAGRESQAREQSDRALAAAAQAESVESLATALQAAGRVAFFQNDIAALSELCERARPLRSRSDDPWARAAARGLDAMLAISRREYPQAVAAAREACGAARRLSPRSRDSLLLLYAAAFFGAGRPLQAERLLRACVARSSRLEPPPADRLATARLYLAACRTGARDTAGAIREAAQCLGIAERSGLATLARDARGKLGREAIGMGYFGLAFRYADELRREAVRQDEPLAENTWERTWLQASLFLGARRHRAAVMDALRRRLVRESAHWYLLVSYVELCEAEAAEGRFEEAVRLGEEALARFKAARREAAWSLDMGIALVLTRLARLHLEAGDLDRGERALTACRGLGLRDKHPAIRSEAERLRAILLLARGRAKAAAAAAARAWVVARATTDTLSLLESATTLARTLAAAGGGSAGEKALRFGTLAAWLGASILKRNKPTHRASIAATPPFRALAAALDALGLPRDIVSREPGASPMRVPGIEAGQAAERELAALAGLGKAASGRAAPGASEIETVLRRCGWNIRFAARELGVERDDVWDEEGRLLAAHLARNAGSARGAARALGIPRGTFFSKLTAHEIRAKS